MVAFKFATLLAAATAVAAYPSGLLTRDGICSTGTLECCAGINYPGSGNYDDYISSLPISLRSLGDGVGYDCIDIRAIGFCFFLPVCCADKFGNVGVNCDPATLPI